MKKIRIGLIGFIVFFALISCLSSMGHVYADDPTPTITPAGPTVTPSLTEPPPEPTPTLYTVRFDANKHGDNPPSIQVVPDGKAAPATPPEVKRWTFECWCTDKNGKKPFDFNTPITKDITLYAKWVYTREITASANKLLTPSTEPTKSETKELTEALTGGSAPKATTKTNVPVPAALQNISRTSDKPKDSPTEEIKEEPTDVPTSEPSPTVLPAEEEIIVEPSPQEPNMSEFKQIEIGEKTYSESFPWITIIGIFFILGTVTAMIVIFKKRKEQLDE